MNISRWILGSLMLMLWLGATGVTYAVTDQEAADMQLIREQFPELGPSAIRPSPISGLYEIRMGMRLSYVSADGRYLIQGDLYDADTEENLTEMRRMAARAEALNAVGESSMIIFSPQEKKTHTITVFTDIDCGYCRKLHRQIKSYNELGIEVRYMFFPRSGPATDSWYKAENVWCADNRNVALTMAKTGMIVDERDCGTTPVAQHYELGLSFGIQGTPAIIAESGELIPGYVGPEELLRYIESE